MSKVIGDTRNSKTGGRKEWIIKRNGEWVIEGSTGSDCENEAYIEMRLGKWNKANPEEQLSIIPNLLMILWISINLSQSVIKHIFHLDQNPPHVEYIQKCDYNTAGITAQILYIAMLICVPSMRK